MTKQSLASLCIKLMAVYVILSSLPALPGYILMIFRAGNASDVWMSLAMMASALMMPAIWLGLGLLIIWFADSIARKLVPDDEDAGVILVSNEDSLQKVFFVCLGMFLTVKALPNVARIVVNWYTADQYDLSPKEYFLYLRILPGAVCFAIQLGLGVFLMIRPETVLGWIKKFQPRGNSPDDNCDDNYDD